MVFLPYIFFAVMAASAATFVGAIIPVLVRLFVRRGWVDRPGERKNHDRPVPAIGGIIIIPVFLACLPVLGFSLFSYAPVYLSALLVWAAGIVDDRFGLSPGGKLLVQVMAALCVALTGGALIPNLGHLFGVDNVGDFGLIAVPFTVVCFIFLMNAVNMIDGVDGLAGGISFVILGWLAVAAMLGGAWPFAAASILMMALLFGFLLHNMRYPGHRRATIFLGDAGSLSLGFVIAWLGVNIAYAPGAVLAPIGMAFIILLPIADAFALFIARRAAGRSPFEPGHDHIHHQVMDRGFTPGQTAMILCVAVCILGAAGLLVPLQYGIRGEGVLTVVWIAFLLGYTGWLVRRIRAAQRRADKTICA